jgi:hypothetical protein
MRILQLKLREDKEVLRLSNIYNNLSREKMLASHIKRVCSSVRNQFRELVGYDLLSVLPFI